MAENAGALFDCSICTLEYGLAQDRIPRVLNCGHTFCTSCLQQCLRMDSISCPFCKNWTRISFGDMSRIPVNFGILDMLQPDDIDSPDKLDNVCEACEENLATIVCISCSPVGVKFCTDCDKKEHDRKFKPVQLHRRMELSEYQPTLVCTRHTSNGASLYSEQLNRFACQDCVSESDWPSRSQRYLPILEAAEILRAKASKKHYNLNNTTRTLYNTQKELDGTLLKLAESISHAKAAILEEFKRLADILQLRQQKLLVRVEQEYESRKQSIDAQKEHIQEQSRLIANHHDALKQLLSLPDRDFLKGYNHVLEQVSFLKNDSMLFYPVAPGDIPCFFKTSLDQELNVHGAVGGGPVPDNVVCNHVPIASCTLPQLSWSLNKDGSEINQYEVEFEHLIDERPCSPNNSGPIVADGEMKLLRVPKSGRAQAHVMNDLYPGYQYRFRVRSKNIAGWGIWSAPVIGSFDDFPIKVAFMGDKVSIKIPKTGQYRITAAGARARDGNQGYKGGLGAVISGTFSLNIHDRIEIAVGGMSQKGTQGHSGGAGGTFVLLCNNGHPTVDNILIVAGGGGGTRGFDEGDKNGCDASLEPDGMDGLGKEHGLGGQDGMSGKDANMSYFQGPCWGYGGAGFLKSSTTAKSYVDGLEGGQCGGYGGGGGVGMLGGGGGGGFSGGGGGRGGGGGGSYVCLNATNVTKEATNDHHGYVLIERLSPEPLLMNGTDSLKHSSGNSSPIMSGDESRLFMNNNYQS